MTAILKPNGAAFSPARVISRLTLPASVYPAGLWWLESGDIATRARNIAKIDLAPATPFGAPTAASGYTVFGNPGAAAQGNLLDTELDEAASFTLLLIARCRDTFADATHRPFLFGNYDFSQANQGIGLSFESATNIGIFGNFTGASPANQSLVAGDQTNAIWQALAVTIESGVGIKLYNLTTAGRDGQKPIVQPRAVSARKLRIGGAYNGYTGQSDIAFLTYLPSVVLTRTQCISAMAKPRAKVAAKHGIIS